ncbi:MAG: VapC toxin family PIN domain ribonuclease [Chloroflexota bacterium]|nr:VapC toxin family PIN domain ribonuclease [Chloroflexota bacterium]
MDAASGVSDLVLSGFLRIVTIPASLPMDRAFPFVNGLRSEPNCVVVEPGTDTERSSASSVELLAYAGIPFPTLYLAALAIESGSEWMTTDRDLSRFPGLLWRHPLE